MRTYWYPRRFELHQNASRTYHCSYAFFFVNCSIAGATSGFHLSSQGTKLPCDDTLLSAFGVGPESLLLLKVTGPGGMNGHDPHAPALPRAASASAATAASSQDGGSEEVHRPPFYSHRVFESDSSVRNSTIHRLNAPCLHTRTRSFATHLVIIL